MWWRTPVMPATQRLRQENRLNPGGRGCSELRPLTWFTAGPPLSLFLVSPFGGCMCAQGRKGWEDTEPVRLSPPGTRWLQNPVLFCFFKIVLRYTQLKCFNAWLSGIERSHRHDRLQNFLIFPNGNSIPMNHSFPTPSSAPGAPSQPACRKSVS